MTHLNQAPLFIFGWRAKKKQIKSKERAKKEQRKSKILLVAAS